jgi:hypothetical protein
VAFFFDRPLTVVLLTILIQTLFVLGSFSQDAIQSPVPQYRADEVKSWILRDVELKLTEPVLVDIQLDIQDAYDTYLFYHSTHPDDISYAIRDKALAWLETSEFGDSPLNVVLSELAAHMEITEWWNRTSVGVALHLPPLNRGGLPIRLSMDTEMRNTMRTSVTLQHLVPAGSGGPSFDLELDFETDSDLLVDPSHIRLVVTDYLSEHQAEADRMDVFNRVLAEYLQETFAEMRNLRTVLTAGPSAGFPVLLVSGIEESGVGWKESVSLMGHITEAQSGGMYGEAYELQLEYTSDIGAAGYPDLATMHDTMQQALAAYDSSETHWRDFMIQTVEHLAETGGASLKYIDLYLDGAQADEKFTFRYLARIGEERFYSVPLYAGYTIHFPGLENIYGRQFTFDLEIADWLYIWGGYVHIPEPEILAYAVVDFARRVEPYPGAFATEALYNRYLASLVWNLGDFEDWQFMDYGDINTRLAGHSEDGHEFAHILTGTTGTDFDSSIRSGETDVPVNVQLFQNYPNPFNPVTHITFSIDQPLEISLEVFDLTGRKVAQSADGMHDQGTHIVRFDARNLASGVYIARLKAGQEVKLAKMVLVK